MYVCQLVIQVQVQPLSRKRVVRHQFRELVLCISPSWRRTVFSQRALTLLAIFRKYLVQGHHTWREMEAILCNNTPWIDYKISTL